MNVVMLIGRFTKDPESKTNGVVRFTLAVDRRASKTDASDFINCVAFRGVGEVIMKYFKKGKEVAIRGNIRTSTYTDKDGIRRTGVDVIVEDIFFIGNRTRTTSANKITDENRAEYEYQGEPVQTTRRRRASSEDFMSVPDTGSDADLPFN